MSANNADASYDILDKLFDRKCISSYSWKKHTSNNNGNHNKELRIL